MSVSVGFDKVGPGTCIWCKKDKEEVFTVAFSDKSFMGPMCKPDLLRAIRSKCEEPVIPTAAPVKTVSNGPAMATPVK